MTRRVILSHTYGRLGVYAFLSEVDSIEMVAA